VPCVKKFPHLVQMHREFADAGLVVMSMNDVDNSTSQMKKVRDFLKEKGATFPNFVIRDSVENWEKWNEKYPSNVTPAVVFFDRQGNRVKVMEGPTDEEVEAEARRLLAQK
jgi:hypothetical protein